MSLDQTMTARELSWRAAGVPGDPEEPGVPDLPHEPGEPTVPDQPPPAPVA